MTLPPGWRTAQFTEVYAVTRRPRSLQIATDEAVPFLPMAKIPSGKLEYRTTSEDLRPFADIPSGTYFQEGDLLLAKITPCFENGKQGVVRGTPRGFGFATTEVIPVCSADPEGDLRYLAYFLLRHDLRSELAARMEGATGRSRLPTGSLKHYVILLPPISEQRRIARFLHRLQHAANIAHRRVHLLTRLKAATLAHLFAPHSETKPLATSIKSADYGTSVRCTKNGPGLPVLRIPNVVAGRIDLRDLKNAELPSNELDRRALEVNDLLFVRTNGSQDNIGRCAIFNGELERATFASYLIRVRLVPGTVLPEFLRFFLNGPGRSQLEASANPAADGKFNINTRTLRELRIPIATEIEQAKIARIARRIESSERAAHERAALLDRLFAATLQSLTSGALRLPDSVPWLETPIPEAELA